MTEDINEAVPEEMSPETQESINTGYNYPGIIAGVLMVILPFTGKWWQLTFGDGALYIGASPFSLTVFTFGEQIISPLLTSLTAALSVITIIFGIALIAGSILSNDPKQKTVSEILVKSGSLKVLYIVIFFLIAVTAAGIGFQQYFTMYGLNGSFPLLSGFSEMVMQAGEFSIMIPVRSAITPAYYLAIITAIIGIASRIYAKKRL
ncbi:MAG: hypothetical protein JXQ82_00870 [Methanomicrobiaceae archaeon]|nr:hypothetical protein [Methanomicrobiaceae archaeon]